MEPKRASYDLLTMMDRGSLYQTSLGPFVMWKHSGESLNFSSSMHVGEVCHFHLLQKYHSPVVKEPGAAGGFGFDSMVS